jgi:hypothetical protein
MVLEKIIETSTPILTPMKYCDSSTDSQALVTRCYMIDVLTWVPRRLNLILMLCMLWSLRECRSLVNVALLPWHMAPRRSYAATDSADSEHYLGQTATFAVTYIVWHSQILCYLEVKHNDIYHWVLICLMIWFIITDCFCYKNSL